MCVMSRALGDRMGDKVVKKAGRQDKATRSHRALGGRVIDKVGNKVGHNAASMP